MAIITISRGSFSGGKSFAENLGKALGYRVISREDLSDEATKMGVPVGKLQTAMVKPPRVYNRMGNERDQYIACLTSLLCEKILEENVIYHGHTGHLLLAGIPHILRIRILSMMENRINSVIQNLNLSREKAKQYIEDVDADRDKWIRFLYGIDWHDPSHYDLIVHLDQLGAGNASLALYNIADLPDFKLTPASIKAIKNLLLASKARFKLSKDAHTKDVEVRVTADDGIVNVTYMPQYAEFVQYVPDILTKLPGCKDVHMSIARTNILWLQDYFNRDSNEFGRILQFAKRWDAAVELMRIVPEVEKEADSSELADGKVKVDPKEIEYTGGIEDDDTKNVHVDEELDKTLDELQKQGCSGGISTIYGDNDSLLSVLKGKHNYSMMVIGSIFTGKSHATQTRKTNELRNLLMDNLTTPVVGLQELEKQLRFGFKDFLTFGLYLLGAIAMFLLVFTNQEFVLQLLAGDNYRSWRIVTLLGIVLFVPAFAYLYGTGMGKILKLFGLD